MRMVQTGIALFAVGLIFGVVVDQTFAENAPEGAIVPAHKASFHVPVFQNDLVRLLNVDIPAGQSSGYHTHFPDLVTVVVEDSTSVAQELAREPNPAAHQPRGNVVYTAYGAGLTHNVTNLGHSPYHLIGIEVLRTQPGGFTPSSRADVSNYVKIVDNEHMRGWRLALEPGQSVTAITQQAPGTRVVVDGGEIAEIVPGQPDRAMLLKPGEFAWQDAGVTRGIRNLGSSRIELVEFELK